MRFKIVKIIKQRRFFFAALLVLAAGLVIWTTYLWWKLFIFTPASAPVSEESTPSACEGGASCQGFVAGTVRRSIDGLFVPFEQASSSLFAVTLDNFPEARPVAGLSAASLVWEAPVEGGMTRFLAVFATSTDLSRLGPVRSARPYFLDWAKELNALYLHVGGSQQALAEVAGKGIFDLNEFYRGQYFWRDSRRSRPYNVYTSTELINQAFAEQAGRQNWQPGELDRWLFKEDAPLAERGDGADIQIDFGKTLAEWKYNRENNLYERWEDGEIQKDESGALVTAKNIVIQYVSVVVLDEVGRRRIKTVGSGRAVIYRDGREANGSWQKKSLSGRVRFFGPDTKEIEFNPGTTWIEMAADR